MMTLLLYKDELKGFYKSSVMTVLWPGLPVLSIVSYLSFPNMGDQFSISYLTSTIISSIAGFLAAMMIAIHIIHEKSHHVYDLFLIRQVKKSQLILSKYLAIFTCITIACLIALTLSFLFDYLIIKKFSNALFADTLKSFLLSIAFIAVECAAGALVGVLVSSVLVGVISVIITHNITGLTIITPVLMKASHAIALITILGGCLSALFLFLAIEIFKKKPI